jgi:hypothetical protein
MTSTDPLEEDPYNRPVLYSDEATLIDIYQQLVRQQNWKENYLAPSGGSWQNIRIWDGNDFETGYVGKSDARVNLIIQSPNPPFKLLLGYNIGDEFANMDSDYRIKQKLNRAFEKTNETLKKLSDVFQNQSVTEYRVLMKSVGDFDDPHQSANKLQRSISDSFDQPDRTLAYLTNAGGDSIERFIRFHDNFPSSEAEFFKTALLEDE